MWNRNDRNNWNLKSRMLLARDRGWKYTPYKRTALYRAVYGRR